MGCAWSMPACLSAVLRSGGSGWVVAPQKASRENDPASHTQRALGSREEVV